MKLAGVSVVLVLLVCSSSAQADSAELVTVTTDSAVATWVTAEPADTTACVTPAAGPQTCRTTETGVRYHRAVMGGLRPGQSVSYVLRSGGVDEPVTVPSPGSFTTLTPPPGRHLFDFALMSDLHVGEGCAGTAFNLGQTSVPPCFSAPDYAARMDAAEVAEIAARGIRLTLIAGDVTAEARPAETARALDVLHGLPGRVMVARGNHDRIHADDSHPCGSDHDCFRTTFYPDRPPGRIYSSLDEGGVHFVMLDSVKGSSTGDLTDAAQNAWLARDLAAHRSMPTFVFFHHPASEYGDVYETEPVIFGVPPNGGGREFLQTVAGNPQIVGVFQAHTHRNFDTYALQAGGRTPFIENGTAKEYPGGYSVISMYQGGYTRSFFRAACEFCREWIGTTSGEYFGLAPQYQLGSLGARNFSHVYGCDVDIPATSLPGQESLATGGIVTPPARCLTRVYANPATAPSRGPGARLVSRTAAWHRGARSALLPLACATAGVCRAGGTLVATPRRGHTVTLGSFSGTVRAGRTGRIRLAFTRQSRRILTRHRRLRARARLRISNPDGEHVIIRGRVTLTRSRRPA